MEAITHNRGERSHKLKDSAKKTARCIGLLFFGALIGAVFITLIYGYRLDMAYKDITDLGSQLSYAQNKLKQLESKEPPQKNLTVDNINPILRYDGHKIELLSIEEYVLKALGHLIGSPVEIIDLELVARVFDGRILTFKSNRCQLKVKYILLAETMDIYIDVTDLPST